MNPLNKLLLVSVGIIAFFVLFCIVWLEKTTVQAFLLLTLLGCGVVAFKPKGMWKIILNLSPFILLLAIVYALFSVFRFGKPSEYWIHYGLTRTMILASSLIFMRLALSFLKEDDFLDFPLSIHKLKYIILGIHLYHAASHAYRDMCVFGDFIPSNQINKGKIVHRIRGRLAIVLSLIIYIINESSQKGEMIDERIRLCHVPQNEEASNLQI